MNTQRAIATTKRFAAGFRRFRYVIPWTCLAVLLCKPVVLVGISGYQRFISPYKGWHCAHAVLHGGASCSAYGKEIVSRHGVLRGGLLLWKRFGDCQQAADTLAANSIGDEVGKQCAAACQKSEKNCADGCVRGCTGRAPRTVPQSLPTQPRSVSRPSSTIQSITVVSPSTWGVYDATGTYSENLRVVTITWESTGVSGKVHIDVSRNNTGQGGVRNWERILSNIANNGQAQWLPTGPATPFARVRVQSVGRPAVIGINSHDFCIYGPYYRGLPGGYCTEYAAREFDKVSPGADWKLGNAQQWFDSAATANWEVTTDPIKGTAGAIMVWTYGTFGHVAILRNYQQNADGNRNVVFDEQNFGSWIVDPTTGEKVSNPITVNFGSVTHRQLPIANLDRNPLKFKGLILPVKKK